jgi:hypothetical protein
MSVRQVVRCDKCRNEILAGGYHIGIGSLHWAHGEVDPEMNACRERDFELCDGCARSLFEHMPMLAEGYRSPAIHLIG